MKKNRLGNLVSETRRICTKCGEEFERTSKNMSICHKCNSERVKSGTIEYKIWLRAKTRAKSKGQEFNIEVKDVVLPEVCPVLGIPLKHNSGKSGAYKDSYSLDRIDNSRGYVKGNVQVISQLANSMKAGANPKEMLLFAKWVLDTYNADGTYKVPLVIDDSYTEYKPKRGKYHANAILALSYEDAHEMYGISKKYYLMLRSESLRKSKDSEVTF